MKNKELILARKDKCFTQEQFANFLGCRKSTISNWENGYSNPSLTDAFRVSKLLEKDVNILFSQLKRRQNQVKALNSSIG